MKRDKIAAVGPPGTGKKNGKRSRDGYRATVWCGEASFRREPSGAKRLPGAKNWRFFGLVDSRESSKGGLMDFFFLLFSTKNFAISAESHFFTSLKVDLKGIENAEIGTGNQDHFVITAISL